MGILGNDQLLAGWTRAEREGRQGRTRQRPSRARPRLGRPSAPTPVTPSRPCSRRCSAWRHRRVVRRGSSLNSRELASGYRPGH